MDAFPSCGCDACDEHAEDQIERLAWLVDQVTAGRFRGAIELPAGLRLVGSRVPFYVRALAIRGPRGEGLGGVYRLRTTYLAKMPSGE